MSDEAVRRVFRKNAVKARRQQTWRLPPKPDAAYGATVEGVLDVYERPNGSGAAVGRRFTTADARIRLKRLGPAQAW